MILVRYMERQSDRSGNALPPILLGTELHDSIDEVLLPRNPQADVPIYFTKKFSGRVEYRWKVVSCTGTAADRSTPQTFDILLDRKPQLHRSEYLSNILKTPGKSVQKLLHRYAFIEIEYGHPPVVGKRNNDIRSNKRYPDSVQFGSMPKRRLAVVNRVSVHAGRPVIQAVPISSVRPPPGDRTAVEVTGSLGVLPDYDKESWAVVSMIETIAPTRIIAPRVRWNNRAFGRDTGFKTTLSVSARVGFRDALMFAVESGGRVQDSLQLAELAGRMAAQEKQLEELRLQLEQLQRRTRHFEAYKEMARDLALGTSRSLDAMRDEYAAMLADLGPATED